MIQIQPDSWLASRLGCDAFRVRVGSETGQLDREAVTASIRACGPGFYYAKVPTERVTHAKGLADAGFYVVDVNVTFELTDRKPSDESAGLGIRVCDVQPSDHEAVLDIAATSFVYSRFHLDPWVSDEKANRIKRDWVENYLRGGRGERLLVAHLDGRPAGFLAVIAGGADGRSCRAIDLIGVARGCQRRGVGHALVGHFVQQYADVTDLLRVGTQAANIPSIRLYEKNGFRVSETSYILHGHFPRRARLQDDDQGNRLPPAKIVT